MAHIGKCIISSLILTEVDVDRTLGAYALMLDETNTWGDLRDVLIAKGFVAYPIERDEGGDTKDWEIRQNPSDTARLSKSELFDSLRATVKEYAEGTSIIIKENEFNMGIGHQALIEIYES